MKEVLAASSFSSTLLLPIPTPTLHPHSHSFTKCGGRQPKSNNIFLCRCKQSVNLLDTPPPSLSSPRILWDSTSDNGRLLKYYADLASTIAESGKVQVFLLIAETLIDSGVNPSEFVSLLNVKLVSEGFRRMISSGNLENVIELLNGFKKIGIRPIELFDELVVEALRQECRRILFKRDDPPQVIVSLMATIQGLEFPAKHLLRTSEVIRFCVNKQDSAAAIMYAQIFPHSQELFCSIMSEFGKKRDLVSALNVFEASKQEQDIPNMYAYRTIIDVCGRCGDYLKSRSIYEELLASNFTPNVYVFNSVMNANARDLGYTLRVYKHMKNVGVTADLASYNILLKACCISGRVDHAKEIYNELIGLESAGDFKLDVFTYSTMIKVFADARMWQMAVRIKEDMQLRGVVPNAVTWSALISACANAGVVEKAFQVFDDMLLAGCEPNSQCCNVLLHACVEAQQYDRAFRLFNSWKKNGIPKDHHLLPQKATLSNNDEDKVIPRWSFIPTTTTYNILMKACGTDYFRAKALMEEMKLEGLSPDEISWSIFIDIVGSSKNGKGALQIVRNMHKAGVQPDVVTYTTAIKVCVQHKDLKSAFSLFAEMKRYQIKPNLVTYNTLLRARRRYGSLQEVQQCLALYQDMRKAGYKPNDNYLKQLIEEWCEGVIQNSHQPKGHFISQCKTIRPESLLIERVAERLQDSNAESLCIDLRGLTKIEARIMVLAVLRMIKENYNPGDTVKDDLSIILEDEGEESFEMDEEHGTTDKHKGSTTEAIIKLLQRDLGLEVLPRETRTDHDNRDILTLPNEEEEEEVGLISNDPSSSKLTMQHRSTKSRRPTYVQRLTISKGSLIHWLRLRKRGASSFSST